MKKRKKINKDRSYEAISAWKRSGSGPHKDKKKYDRKKIRSQQLDEDNE